MLDRSKYEQKNDRAPTQASPEDFLHSLHEKGHIALRCLDFPFSFKEILEDRQIMGNLREDGGSKEKPFYPNVSATVLPKSDQRIRQDLFRLCFVGINLEKSKTKGFSFIDAYSEYKINKKTKRPTYGMESFFYINHRFVDPEWNNWEQLNDEKRLNLFDHVYDRKNISNGRPMNEVVVKVNAQSMLFLGCTAIALNDNPNLLLGLICEQEEFRKITGRIFPIVVYNSFRGIVKLNLFNKTLEPNSFLILDNECLQKFYPAGDIRAQKSQDEIDKSELIRRQSIQTLVQTTLSELDSNLKAYRPEDKIIGIHKEGNKKALPVDHYKEINQQRLTEFIIKNYFSDEKIVKDKKLAKDDIIKSAKFNYLTKMYNLQFRLNRYNELLSEKTLNLINFNNLNDDLEWYHTLQVMKKIEFMRTIFEQHAKIIGEAKNLSNQAITKESKPIIYNPEIPFRQQAVKHEDSDKSSNVLGVPYTNTTIYFKPIMMNNHEYYISLNKKSEIGNNDRVFIYDKVSFEVIDVSAKKIYSNIDPKDIDNMLRNLHNQSQEQDEENQLNIR